MWAKVYPSSEEFHAVRGYEGLYEVSNQGMVRSIYAFDKLRRHREPKNLTPQKRKSGHLAVGLSKDGRRTMYLVHRLVLYSFCGEPPDSTRVLGLHKDDNPENNNINNLYWGSRLDNARDCLRNGGNVNKRKELCLNGHPLKGDNLRLTKRGQRQCVECSRVRWREYYYRSKGQGVSKF